MLAKFEHMADIHGRHITFADVGFLSNQIRIGMDFRKRCAFFGGRDV